MFFGMGIEEKLLEPMRRKRQAKKGESCSPKPLPMLDIESDKNGSGICRPVTLVVPKHDYPGTRRVIRRDVLPVIPVGNGLDEFGAKIHLATPNVQIEGLADTKLERSPES